MIKNDSKFLDRHLGPVERDIDLMLKSMSFTSIDDLIKNVIPTNIFSPMDVDLIENNHLSEDNVLDELQKYANENMVYKSFIGMGYYGTIIPNVIKRIVIFIVLSALFNKLLLRLSLLLLIINNIKENKFFINLI